MVPAPFFDHSALQPLAKPRAFDGNLDSGFYLFGVFKMMRSGGFLCGDLRYELKEDDVHFGYCHCRMCQFLSDSTVLERAEKPAFLIQ